MGILGVVKNLFVLRKLNVLVFNLFVKGFIGGKFFDVIKSISFFDRVDDLELNGVFKCMLFFLFEFVISWYVYFEFLVKKIKVKKEKIVEGVIFGVGGK